MTQFLGPDGQPINKSPDLIPVVQWLPGGNSIGRLADRGEGVYAVACRFLSAGGRYYSAFRADNVAELVAGFPVEDGAKGEIVLVARETVENGVEVGLAIDRLVIASVEQMGREDVRDAVAALVVQPVADGRDQ